VRRTPRRKGRRDAPIYQACTRDVVVRVIASYAPDQSDERERRHFWTYTVEIENRGQETVQLISRHWIITDGQNRVQEVTGLGVVGEQPTLKPSEAFRYTSGCPLATSSGAMRGSYHMVTREGDAFDVEIPEFSLHLPGAGRVVN
jgi:ApaG protein